MSSNNRWSPSPAQGFLVGALVTCGLFLLACGVGMTSIAVGVLGVALAVGGPFLIAITGLRGDLREFTYGTARVHEVSPPPTDGASVGRCELEIVVTAKGVDSVPVRLRDHAVPVAKWPELGASLPVLVSARDARHVRVLWDEVPAARPAAADDVASPEAERSAEYPEGGYPYDEYEDERYDDGEEAEADPLFGFSGEEDERNSEGEALEDEALDRDESLVASPDERRDSSDPPEPPAAPSVAAAAASEAHANAEVPAVPRSRRPRPYPSPSPVVAQLASTGGTSGSSEPADSASLTSTTDGAPVTPPAPRSAHREDPVSDPDPLDGTDPAGVSVTMIVSNLDRSREFYREILGLREVDITPPSAVLAFRDAHVVLRQVNDMPPIDRRVVHLNLDVPDVQEAYDRMREKGVEFVHRPRVVQRGEHLELCSATFRDPDGHAIALTRWAVRR